MKKSKKAEEVEFIAEARKRFARVKMADQHNIDQARRNLNFVYDIEGGQWDEKDRNQREEDGRACLTSNQLEKHVHGVVNAERDQRVAGNVIPVDSEGDVATANIISGIIRQIEHASNADKVYTNGGLHAVAANVGYWRIVSEEKDDSFDQELFIKEIRNPFSVTLDPDGMFAFVDEKMTKDEFKYKYPDADEEDVDYDLENYNQWYPDEDSLYTREYLYKERVKTTIVSARKIDLSGQLSGETKIFDLGQEGITEEQLESLGWSIEKKKTPKRFKVKWSKITGSQVVARGEWPGKEIPIVEVEGNWIWIDGKVYKKNLTQGAHDDQRMYNFTLTSLVERYSLQTKAPYLVTKKMVAGLGHIWKVAHKKLFPYLAFNHDAKMPGGPKREPSPQISAGETTMLGVHKENIMDTVGRYESSFGKKSNERSKVAIDARAARGEVSTFHFPDNYKRAVVKSTRILIDVIPHFYDTERVERIIGSDGKSQGLVMINEETGFLDRDGEPIILNDLSIGKYDVVESIKLMSTRRQEQLQGMLSMAEGNPMLGIFLAGDIAKLQDWDGSQELAEKIDANLPALLGIKPEDQEGAEGEQGA